MRRTSVDRRTFSLTIESLANAAQKLIETSIAAISVPNLRDFEQLPDLFGAFKKNFPNSKIKRIFKKKFFFQIQIANKRSFKSNVCSKQKIGSWSRTEN